MPGHERFVRTMVSGATGVNGVLLVVAANEGVQPQTVEHVDIAGLLGLRRAIVVVTKADLVPPAQAQAAGRAAGLLAAAAGLAASAPVLTSAARGAGLDALRAAIAAALAATPDQPDDGFAYLPVDRAFTIAGHGTVVTGTLRHGRLAAGDVLQVAPAGAEVRVRGVQVHGTPAAQGEPGQRVAVNLRGAGLDALGRGAALCSPGLLAPAPWLSVQVRAVAGAPALANGAALRLLFGTTEVDARLRLLDRDHLEPGESALAQLHCGEPVAVPAREPFILRVASPPSTVAGGTVLDPDDGAPAPPRAGVRWRGWRAWPGPRQRGSSRRRWMRRAWPAWRCAGWRGSRAWRPRGGRVAGRARRRADPAWPRRGGRRAATRGCPPAPAAAPHAEGPVARGAAPAAARTWARRVLDEAAARLVAAGTLWQDRGQAASAAGRTRGRGGAGGRGRGGACWQSAAPRRADPAGRAYAGAGRPRAPAAGPAGARRRRGRAPDQVQKRDILFHHEAVEAARQLLRPLLRRARPAGEGGRRGARHLPQVQRAVARASRRRPVHPARRRPPGAGATGLSGPTLSIMEAIGVWWPPWSSKPVARQTRAVGSIPIRLRRSLLRQVLRLREAEADLRPPGRLVAGGHDRHAEQQAAA